MRIVVFSPDLFHNYTLLIVICSARSGSVPSATIKPPFLGIFSIAGEQVHSILCAYRYTTFLQ